MDAMAEINRARNYVSSARKSYHETVLAHFPVGSYLWCRQSGYVVRVRVIKTWKHGDRMAVENEKTGRKYHIYYDDIVTADDVAQTSVDGGQ